MPSRLTKSKYVSEGNPNCVASKWNRYTGSSIWLAARVVLNGSFATDVFEPNDVDCILLIQEGFPRDKAAEAELIAGLPFLEINLVNQTDFDFLVEKFFATDRHSVAKGMLEVIL